ncbi:16S rRNA (cytosine(967)-C(5))-methyltransferase RsmB [Planifilum fimeticola]
MNREIKGAREVALDVLIAVEERGAYSNLLLNRTLERTSLSPRDRRLATELVYGTIQRLNTLDWILDRFVKKGVRSLQPWVRQLLRLGLYQLHYLDRMPYRAAVHETVNLAKRRGHKGIAGLVNGVLRAYLRDDRNWSWLAAPRTVEDWALATSHPVWMVRRFQEVFGEETAWNILSANNEPPPLSLRVNPLKADRERLLLEIAESSGGEARPSLLSPQGIVLRGFGSPASLPGFREGMFTVQDESSMLVAEAVAPRPGQFGLDACAAPGGKTTHLAEKMGNRGRIVALDIHPHKLRLIEENARRLGISIVEARQADARDLTGAVEEPADFVLLDAPCSGLGVIRRKPDIKWRKETADIDGVVALQWQMLISVSRWVRPGGTLVYSTCTLEPRENEEQIRRFLEKHPEFTPDEGLSDLLSPAVIQKASIAPGMVRILPHHFGSDGFFIARLVRKK